MAKCQHSSICSLSASTAPHAPADPQLACSSTLLSRLLGHRMFLLEPWFEISIPQKSAIPNTASREYTISFFIWGKATYFWRRPVTKTLLFRIKDRDKRGQGDVVSTVKNSIVLFSSILANAVFTALAFIFRKLSQEFKIPVYYALLTIQCS